MKFKINSKFNIKIFFSNSKFNIKVNSKLNETHMIFTRFRDIDQDCLFPYSAGGFELTIGANGDQAEEEAIEDEDKEEEEATTILRNT